MENWFSVTNSAITFLPWDLQIPYAAILKGVLGIVIILIVAKVLNKAGARIIHACFHRRKLPFGQAPDARLDTTSTLMVSIWRYVVYFFAIIAILGVLGLGQAATSLLATAGIGGIAIGLGAQDLFKDVINGFFLLFEDQFRVGDYVTIGSFTGTVESISMRVTQLRCFRGEVVTIPNGGIEQVVNLSRGNSLALVDVKIPIEGDVEQAIALLQDVAAAWAEEQGEALPQPPEVLGAVDIGGEGITLRLVSTTQPLGHWEAERRLRVLIKKRFEQAGMPFAVERRQLVPAPAKEETK